jgi:DNA-damage-inducible protein J
VVRIAADKEFPFAVKTPNATTRKAMAELEKGKGKRFASADKLFKDLGV